MQQKYFLNPFAEAGDKTAVPDALDPSGFVSYEQGYGFDYERNNDGSDPLAKNIERQKMNELFFDITSNIQQYQQNGVPEFITSANNGGTPYSYSIDAKVRYDDSGTGINWRVYRSKANTNIALPTDTTKWELAEYAALAPQYTGIKSSNLASASTVNIGAATGDYIHITGTTTITAFDTIAAGIERTIVFDGALTLTHNATSLILPTGANITTAAGDTAIFKSEGSGNWRCVSYNRKDGTALSGVITKDFSYKSTPVSISSWSYSTTTITLNVASHTFVADDYIEVTGLTSTTYPANGIHKVTSVTSTTIVFTLEATPTGTAGVSSATVKGYATVNNRVAESVGVNQTWQNVGASRAAGTTYTNTTGKPIMVCISASSSSASGAMNLYINGVVSAGSYCVSGLVNTITIIIPNGSTYSIAGTATFTISYWFELR